MKWMLGGDVQLYCVTFGQGDWCWGDRGLHCNWWRRRGVVISKGVGRMTTTSGSPRLQSFWLQSWSNQDFWDQQVSIRLFAKSILPTWWRQQADSRALWRQGVPPGTTKLTGCRLVGAARWLCCFVNEEVSLCWVPVVDEVSIIPP